MEMRNLSRFAKYIGTFFTGATLGAFAIGCGDNPSRPERGSRVYTLEQGKPVAVGLEGIGNYHFTLKRAYPSGHGRPLAEIDVQAEKRSRTLSFDPFHDYHEFCSGRLRFEGDVSHLALFNGDFLDKDYLRGLASTPTADFVIEDIKGAGTPSLEDDVVSVRVDVNKYLR